MDVSKANISRLSESNERFAKSILLPAMAFPLFRLPADIDSHPLILHFTLYILHSHSVAHGTLVNTSVSAYTGSGSCGITAPNAAAHIISASVTAIIFMP